MNPPGTAPTIEPVLSDFIRLNEEIVSIVRARLPLEPHLEQVSTELPGRVGKIVERISSRLQSGERLNSAIEAECADLPPIYRATMLAGTLSGHPGKSIEMLVDTARRMQQVRRVTGLALLYPLIVLTVTSLLFGFVVTCIVPSFAWLNHLHFGAITVLSDWPLASIILAVTLPVLVVSVFIAWWWRSGRIGGTWSARFGILAWLPGARRITQWSTAAEFAELLLLMVENEVPLDHALHLLGEASTNNKLRVATAHIAENARQGNALLPTSSQMQDPILTSFPLLVRLALCHSGNRSLFTSILRQASSLYRDRALRAAEWYAEYTPIMLTIVVGGTLTLAFALLVLWPYASALREVSATTWR